MRSVAGFALAFVGLSIAVLAGTGERLGTVDLARRTACERSISYGILPVSYSDQRVGTCIEAAARRAAKPTFLQLASSDMPAAR